MASSNKQLRANDAAKRRLDDDCKPGLAHMIDKSHKIMSQIHKAELVHDQSDQHTLDRYFGVDNVQLKTLQASDNTSHVARLVQLLAEVRYLWALAVPPMV
jgi:hypothetical protein